LLTESAGSGSGRCQSHSKTPWPRQHFPDRNRDPWDRIMMAQALAERFHVVTVDRLFYEYDVPAVW
jgi:PIN domain nuclease of toxin-antitoxin system